MRYDEQMLKNVQSVLVLMDHWSLSAFTKRMSERGYDYSEEDWGRYIKYMQKHGKVVLPS